jgi:hypothetical protein
MLLGGPQNTIKSHLVFTALFCFAPFSVIFSRMSAPYCPHDNGRVISRAACRAISARRRTTAQCYDTFCKTSNMGATLNFMLLKHKIKNTGSQFTTVYEMFSNIYNCI